MDGANKYFYNVPNIFPAQFKTRTTRDVMSDVSFTRDPRLTSVGRNKKKNQRQGSSVDQYCMTKVSAFYIRHILWISQLHTPFCRTA